MLPLGLWLRVRRVAGLLIALFALVASGEFLGSRAVEFPMLYSAGAEQTLVTSFLPLLWAALIADAFAARRLGLEIRPVPRAGWPVSRLGMLDATLLLAATGAMAAGFAVLVVRIGSPWAGVGPVLVLSGLTCAVTVRAGAAAAMFASSTLLISNLMYGVTAPAGRYIHIVQPDGAPLWSIGCGAVACAVAGWLLVADRVSPVLRRDQAAE